VEAFTFEIESDGNVKPNSPFKLNFRDNVADFEIVCDGGDNIVLIAAQEYEKTASFVWLKDINNQLIQKGKFEGSLVPNFLETHQHINFKCQFKDKDLLCVNTGKNLFSYVTKYQVNFKEEQANEFIKFSTVATKLRNIVNLKPLRIDFAGDFVTVMVQNRMPLKEGATPDHRTFFTDSFLCLVYKINTSVPKVGELDYEERDVYKILTIEDLGVKDPKNLQSLDPKLFVGKDGAYKLGINIGSTEKPFKVFNLDGLLLAIAPAALTNADIPIGFKSISSKTTKLSVKDFAIVDPSKDTTTKKSNSKLFMVILICAIILIIAVVVVGVVMTKKDGQTAEDYNIDDVEKTMKQPDESVSGNYSKL